MENAEVEVGSRPGKPGEGPKYFVDIEGEKYDWDDDQISVPEIRSLGSLPENLPVLMIDLRTNEQRTLAEDEVVELTPGMGFSQKFQFKRG
ncbi:MAG: multiubiquitin domain-containing protein [Opitutales bacterium]